MTAAGARRFFADIRGVFVELRCCSLVWLFPAATASPAWGLSWSIWLPLSAMCCPPMVQRNAWAQSVEAIKTNLEAGLNGIPVGMAEWGEIVSAIRGETAKLILNKTRIAEATILGEKVAGGHAPSRLLERLFNGSPQNAESIHVITTNYDTLLELFCDLAEIPLDTGFTGFRRRKPHSQPSFRRNIVVF